MAHNIEPMDIDINSDFDNKENSIHHSNVYPRTPCTEKGYEELDVSELNMKLRYSVTPTSSPMSKSYTANSIDNKSIDFNGDIINGNLTQSYNSTLSKSDLVTKSNKLLPLQPISTDRFIDNNRSTSLVRSLEATEIVNAGDITVTVTNENYHSLETPSLSSSAADTPETTTPTKELPRSDGGSPIMRGLKSVLNMFRSSQSPIPPAESGDVITQQVLSPGDDCSPDSGAKQTQAVLASTPITKENASKRHSPLKESIIFNDDLEKELLWKDETTILFSQEKIPIHKLFYQQPLNNVTQPIKPNSEDKSINENNFNDTVEYMDVSCNDFIIKDHLPNVQSKEQLVGESDGEFVDCETTFTNDKSELVDTNELVNNAMLESNPKSQSDLNSTVQSLHQNVFSSISNKSSLSVSLNKTDNIDMSHSQNAIHVEMSDPMALQNLDVETHEACNSTAIVEELNMMSKEPVSTSNASLQHERNMEMCNKNEFAITAESNLKIQDTMIDAGSSLNNESDKDLLKPAVDTYNTVTEKPAAVISDFENKDTKSQASNNRSDNIMYNSPDSNVTSLQGDSFQDNVNHIEPSDSDKLGIQDSSNRTIDRNPTEINHISIEILKEQHVQPSNEYKKMAGNETDHALPANIPLPDEDCFDLETQSNTEGFSNISLNINSSDVHKVAFDTHIESLELKIDAMPTKSLISHPSQDENNTIHVNIDENLVTSTDIQESDVKDSTVLINENNEIGFAETVNDVTQQLMKDIDDIVREAECEVQFQQTQVSLKSENVELNLPDDFQFKKKYIDDENVTLPCESSLNNQNDTIVHASQSQLTSIDMEILNQSVNLETCNETNSDANKAIQLLNIDKQLESSHDIIEKILPDNSSKQDCSGEDTIMTYCDEKETVLEVTQDFNKEEKSESLPDVISDTTSYSMSDVSSVKFYKNTVKPNDNNSAQANFTQIKTEEEMLRKKGETEVNIDEEVILSEDNSPIVSIAGEITQPDKQPLNIEDAATCAIETEFPSSPLISPKIISKGYNFNFDEIDDPFATKTKIRLSPPPDSPKENILKTVDKSVTKREINKNRHKSQQELNNISRKSLKNIILKENTPRSNNKTVKPLDSILQAESLENESKASSKQIIISNPEKDNLIQNIQPDIKTNQLADKSIATISAETNALNKTELDFDKGSNIVINKENTLSVESVNSSNDLRNTSSSEQSTYYSAETSTEATKNKNVFNIPEINDINFNPFLTKPKMRESPVTCTNDSLSPKCNDSSKQFHPINKSSEELDEKDCSDISSTTDAKDITIREVHTEDEDTIEGPFLETEDLNNYDKMSDFDANNVDMIQFSELPPQGNEEQLEGEEMFIDAEAFEFLLNQNKSNAISNSGKESLFLKFDPLFAKRVSTDGVLAALNKVQKRQSTPKKVSVAQQLDITLEKSDLGPSTSNKPEKPNILDSAGDNTDDLNVAIPKPMMVVTPAVNPIVTPRNKPATPTSSNRRSITFTSPAIAVIDRLLSLSGNNSMLSHDNTMSQANREQNEAEHALTQLRELLAEKEIHVFNLRSESKELKNRLSTLESQMQTLETESEERLKKINDLNEKLSEKTKLNKSMAAVVEEYERTIASLIAENEQDRRRHNEERLKLVKERDEQTDHLTSMEISFSDLHSKYEKSKQIIMTCKANEDTYKKSIKEFEESLSKMQSNYELLKQHATTKLNHANQELEKMNRTHETEVLKLNAMIKRKELHITSLEETLAQKTKANEELTAICDELINKVG